MDRKDSADLEEPLHDNPGVIRKKMLVITHSFADVLLKYP